MKYAKQKKSWRWWVGSFFLGAALLWIGLAYAVKSAVFATQPTPPQQHWSVGLGGNPSRNSFSLAYGPVEPSLLWQGGEPATIARQPVIEGNVVVMERIQSLEDLWHGTQLVAQDLQTGETLWATELPVDLASDWSNRVSAVHNGRVFASRSGSCGNKAYLYALNLVDGEVLWRSADLVDECSTDGASFAANGDLLVGNHWQLLRIDAATGETVWKMRRSCPTSGGCAAAVYGDRAYIWEVQSGGPAITAVYLPTGEKIDTTAVISAGFIQQVAPFVGPDGTVYAPRTQNNAQLGYLVAFHDNGKKLVEKWRVPLGYVPYASFGVGPDGSVYSYGQDNTLVRLDPENGAELNRSPVLTSEPPLRPRIAIDVLGNVFVTNGAFADGRLFGFTPDLSLLWQTAVPRVNLCGPALGQGNVLVVCGVGNDVRAYQAEPVVTVTPSPTAEPTATPVPPLESFLPLIRR